MRILITPYLFVLFLSICYADDERPIPPISDPPVSSGINRGFSRKPNQPVYDREKRMLVLESIGDTVVSKKSGNNHVFQITQFEIGERGESLKETSRCVFEGSDRMVNEITNRYPSVAPYVFRSELGDGKVGIYLVEMNANDDLERMIILFYDKNDKLISTQLIYQRSEKK